MAQPLKSIFSPISSSPGPLLHPTLSYCLLSPGPQQPTLRLVSQLPTCSLTFTLYSTAGLKLLQRHPTASRIRPSLKPECPHVIIPPSPLSLTFLSVLQPHWPSVCFLNTPSSFPSHSLWTGSFLLNILFQTEQDPHPSFRSRSEYFLLRGNFCPSHLK